MNIGEPMSAGEWLDLREVGGCMVGWTANLCRKMFGVFSFVVNVLEKSQLFSLEELRELRSMKRACRNW